MNVELLREICETPGAPGREAKVRAIVYRELEKLADDISTDNMGNVYVLKKGQSSDKKMMVAAHMDEIGFVVTHIDDKGFLRFHPLGGFDPKTLTNQRVVVHGTKSLVGVMGAKPIHVMSPDERTKAPKIKDYFIDLGMSAEEVKKVISVGDSVTRDGKLIEMGDCFNSKSLDNRVSVFSLIEAFKKMKTPGVDFYAVFTVQEEVGLRGAHAASLMLNPDFALALDTTIAFDTPGAAAHEKITSLGEGVAVKLMDSSAIADYRMIRYLKKLAIDNTITWQPEILTGGGTDTAALQKINPGGAIAGAISIPTRHIHQVIEMVNKHDVQGAIDLLCLAIENTGTYDWKHD
jgi:endoglucanase